jgi:uncharacterized protein (DUF302 family)
MFRSLIVALALPCAALAEGQVTYDTDADFADVAFYLENAIIEEGLKIDHTSHVGDMLERTREDVGSDVVLYDHAVVYSFCSATLSRQVMEADPMNLGFCPYRIFAMQVHGSDTVTVGYHTMPDGAMQVVEALLDRIARAAVE